MEMFSVVRKYNSEILWKYIMEIKLSDLHISHSVQYNNTKRLYLYSKIFKSNNNANVVVSTIF